MITDRDIITALECDIRVTDHSELTATHCDDSAAEKRDRTAIITLSVSNELLKDLIENRSL
jgi:hypothetical protein